MNKYTEFTKWKTDENVSKENIKFLCHILEHKRLKDSQGRTVQINNVDVAKIFIELLEDMNIILNQDDIVLLNKDLTTLYAFISNTIYVINAKDLTVQQYKITEFDFSLSYNNYSYQSEIHVFYPATIKTLGLNSRTNIQFKLSQEDTFDPDTFNDKAKQIIKKKHS